jgi:dTDP-4-dehydrorhamnose reductase
MRVVILGAGGQLAQELAEAFAGEEVLGLTHAQADICDTAVVERHVRSFRPDYLINTAAFHRVDECEDRVAESFAVNAVAVSQLARIANETRGALVHFSTDYVFDGNQRQPYCETDPPNPLSIYAMSKLAGEQVVRRYAERYILIRTCGLYGRTGRGSKRGNFVERMLRLAKARRPIRVVNDQILTPTSAKDLAAKLALLIQTERCGLYHMTSGGKCSWYEFAREIFRLAGLNPLLTPVTSAEFGARARRPFYSVLEHQALKEAGIADFRPWQEALADYMRTRR